MDDILKKSRIDSAIEVAIEAAEILKDKASEMPNPEKGFFALASLLQSIASLESEITKRAVASGAFDDEDEEEQQFEEEANVIRMPTASLHKIPKD